MIPALKILPRLSLRPVVVAMLKPIPTMTRLPTVMIAAPMILTRLSLVYVAVRSLTMIPITTVPWIAKMLVLLMV